MSAELFLDNLPLIEEVIRFACRRHQLSGADAEDFAASVKLRLVDADYAVLRRFTGATGGGASLRAYLTVVIHRLLLDERIARWGKWRPSAEAKRRGLTALRLEELLYRDGLTTEAAYRRLIDEQRIPTTRAELEELRQTLPRRNKRRLVSDADLQDHPAPDSARPDAELQRREAEVARREALAQLRSALDQLQEEDRAILRLRFEQGLTVQQLAPLLALEAKPLYRRLERILLLLRRSLEGGLAGRGFDPRDIVPSLGSVWFESDEPEESPRSRGPRPSMESETPR
jgi:RNA polymerase sigma factor for flagellar operon FliA